MDLITLGIACAFILTCMFIDSVGETIDWISKKLGTPGLVSGVILVIAGTATLRVFVFLVTG